MVKNIIINSAPVPGSLGTIIAKAMQGPQEGKGYCPSRKGILLVEGRRSTEYFVYSLAQPYISPYIPYDPETENQSVFPTYHVVV